MKFRKKPVVVEAWPATLEYKDTILDLGTKERPIAYAFQQEYFEITTLEGVMRANKNDMIIKGVNGEVYPCKLDIFEKTYESVTDLTP